MIVHCNFRQEAAGTCFLLPVNRGYTSLIYATFRQSQRESSGSRQGTCLDYDNLTLRRCKRDIRRLPVARIIFAVFLNMSENRE